MSYERLQLFQLDMSFINRLANDGSLAADGLQSLQVGHGGDTTTGNQSYIASGKISR